MSSRLRAVGRLLVFVALVLIVFPAKRRWLRAALHGADGTVVYLVDHMIELAAILLFCAILATIERRPFRAFGLPWGQALGARFWQGAGVGLASLTLLVFVLRGAGALQIELSSAPALQAAGFFVVYAVVFALLALREEFLYRGYGLFTLTQVAGFWLAALASTLWFSWSHSDNANENLLGLTNVAAFGLLACLMLRRTGNLWMAIGFHTAWNWGQTYLFGVGDSGHPPAPGHLLTATVSPTAPGWLSGAMVGPEGSALCTVLIAVLTVLLARVLRGVRYPERPADIT
jgi:membrane protease YdiL (CAAX protease family)